ncbi:MAG: PaaX family transcriptional regulator C-terminal domain-containing protein [Giesbergeria sp.]|nr:PaaX family transcriptional regulator C-terminal domain-containing protein [Giesbergeria sp.]
MSHNTPTKVQPKHLLLELLLASGDDALPVSHAVAAGAVFGLSENHVRVTLARLAAQDMVLTTERGAYRLGPAARSLAQDVANWRSTAQRLRPWNGQYVAVHCGALARSDRNATQQRERALHLLGFAELQRDFYVRPDNIEPDIAAIRKRLHALGLEPQAVVCGCTSLDAATEAAVDLLWDGAALNHAYRATQQRLEAWLAGAAHLPTPQAARESFFLGGAAIRQLVYDPLLPEPMVDGALRQTFIDSVHAFDAAGRAIWNRFYDTLPTPDTAPRKARLRGARSATNRPTDFTPETPP